MKVHLNYILHLNRVNYSFYIALILFSVVSTQLFAQKEKSNSNTGAPAGEINATFTPSTRERTTPGAQSDNSVNEIVFWKTYTIEEAAAKPMYVNVDSIYVHYATIKKYRTPTPNFYILKIIPNQSLSFISKIAKQDTVLFNKVIATNKCFSTLLVDNEKDYNAIQNFLPQLDQFISKTTFTTSEIINNILPPYIITEKSKNSVNEYSKFITNYFTMNPEVIYYCNNSFLNMLAKKQYQKIMQLHLKTPNKLELTSNNVK